MSTFEQKALDYHKAGGPGKIAIAVTKSVASQDFEGFNTLITLTQPIGQLLQ
eukprot:gene45131-56193_t